MKPLLWVVQNNLGTSNDTDRLHCAFRMLDIQSQFVEIVPFSDDVPKVDWDGPIIAYGSTRFIGNVSRETNWRPGAFFDRESFSMRAYIKHYGSNVLNAEGIITTIEAFRTLGYALETRVFVRPLLDLKAFEAQIIDVGTLQAWFDKICHEKFELEPTTEILVARPKEIEAEWRIFLVDGSGCAGSLYCLHGEPSTDRTIPREVTQFAETLAGVWMPARAVAMDIGLTKDGHKLIELNCFNSAGFYDCDVKEIVEKVSALAVE